MPLDCTMIRRSPGAMPCWGLWVSLSTLCEQETDQVKDESYSNIKRRTFPTNSPCSTYPPDHHYGLLVRLLEFSMFFKMRGSDCKWKDQVVLRSTFSRSNGMSIKPQLVVPLHVTHATLGTCWAPHSIGHDRLATSELSRVRRRTLPSTTSPILICFGLVHDRCAIFYLSPCRRSAFMGPA